jgi:hypothetical protein
MVTLVSKNTNDEREAVPNLKAQTPFLSMTKQRPLPLRQGNQIQFYTYALLAANLNQAAEGTVGSPISESSIKIVATIGQLALADLKPDYIR